MNTPDKIDGKEFLVDAALQYLRLGYRPIPLPQGSKGANIKWKAYQDKSPTEREVMEWFQNGPDLPNIALVTGSGLCVVDVDDPTILEAVLAHVGETPMKCRTPRGGTHCYYRMRAGVHYGNAVNIKSEGDTKAKSVDLRCEGSYVVAPWSRTENGSYRWKGAVVPPSELPLLRVGWLRPRSPKRRLQPIEPSDTVDEMVRRARSYLAFVEPAISGRNGHKQTMRAAGVLIQKFSLTIEEAMPLFEEWNQQCEPMWTSKELLHKLSDAVRLKAEKGLKRIE